jgi:hypothetical protein
VNHLINKFELEVINKWNYKTPGTPRFKIQKPTADMDVLDVDSQKKYRSGADMLLYLTKYSRPDICNMVFELSECMHSATWAAYEELLYVIKFTSDTKSFGLKVEPKTHKNIKWNLNFVCDSDWAGDPETRVRITGFIIYL